MIIPFPYEIINRYYKGDIYKNDVIKSIKLSFDNYNNYNNNYNNKIKEYNNILFGCCNYIELWIDNNIKDIINEPGYFSELDNLYYIDLIIIFEKFFN